MNKKINIIQSLIFLLFVPFIFADTIVLKSGKVVEGKITEKTDKSIKMDIEGVAITYYLDSINTIDGKAIQPVQENKGLQKETITSSKVNAVLGREDVTDVGVVVSDERLGLLLNSGLNYAKAGRHREAIAEYEKALQIDQNFSTAYSNMGASYKYLGDSQKAIECFQKALAINPKEIIALNNLAAVYAELKKNDEALIYFKKAIEVSPDNALLCEGLGLTYVNLGQYKEAGQWFQKAIQNDPKDPVLYYELGLSYFYLRDYEQAKKNFLIAKEMHKTLGKGGSTSYIDNALSKIP